MCAEDFKPAFPKSEPENHGETKEPAHTSPVPLSPIKPTPDAPVTPA